jgi:hypothetical protein
MSGVIWIDERGDFEGRRQRLHTAHQRARAKRTQAVHSQYRREDKQRGYPVYQHGRKYRKGPQSRNIVDAFLLIGGLTIVAMLMGTAGL